jgi:hypothetical protein
MPDWLKCNTTSGNGSGYIVFTTITPNLGAGKKYASFILFTDYSVSIPFIIIQKERTSGIPEIFQESVKIFPVPASGNLTIESDQEVEEVTIYNSLGIAVMSSGPKYS